MGVALPCLAQPPDHLQPVHAGQAQIQHDQVHRIALEKIQRRFAVAGFLHAIVLRRQRGLAGSAGSAARHPRSGCAADVMSHRAAVRVKTAPWPSAAIGGDDGAAHRFHEAAGDGKAQGRCRRVSCRWPAPGRICRTPARDLLPAGRRPRPATAIRDHAAFARARAMVTAVPGGAYLAALSSRLNSTCSNSTGSSRSSGRPGSSSSVTRCSPAAARAPQHDAHHIGQVHRFQIGRQRAGFQPGHVQQIGDEMVEPFGFLLDGAEQFVLRRRRQAGAIGLAATWPNPGWRPAACADHG